MTSTFDWINPVWQFLSSPIGTIVLLLAGFGILIYLVVRPEKGRDRTATKQSEKGGVDSSQDALEHFLIENRQHRSLSVLNGLPEKPVVYPVVLRNTRPIPIDIKGYEATILWDDRAAETIKWQAPSAFTTAGIRVEPSYDDMSPVDSIRIEGDSPRELQLHVNLLKINHWPDKSPKWSVRGHLYLECVGELRTKPFDLSKEYYELKQGEWDKLKTELDSKTRQLENVSLIITLNAWGIGITGHRGYPSKQTDETWWLRLETSVDSAGRPIDRMDLVIDDNKPIPAHNWTRQVESHFNLHFDISEWRYKGTHQIELVAYCGDTVSRTVKKPVDFDMEPFGRRTF